MSVDRIESYRIAAAWYAWGRNDGAAKEYRESGFPAPEGTYVDTFEFADFVEKAVRAYDDAGDSSALSSIQDLYDKFLTTKGG